MVEPVSEVHTESIRTVGHSDVEPALAIEAVYCLLVTVLCVVENLLQFLLPFRVLSAVVDVRCASAIGHLGSTYTVVSAEPEALVEHHCHIMNVISHLHKPIAEFFPDGLSKGVRSLATVSVSIWNGYVCLDVIRRFLPFQELKKRVNG